MKLPDVITITKREARRLAVRHAGLSRISPFGKGKKAVYKTIQHLGYVQLDTISVVKRAHHHTLWNRAPNYKPEFLFHLQTRDKKILEYWAHAAAYLPMEDYRYSLIIKQFFKDKKDRWPKPEPGIMAKVYERVKSEGPLMARDFQRKQHKGGSWWDWKPAKWALERLFLEGGLVVIERRGFQKVYDLPERYIPSSVETSIPSGDEYASYLIHRYLNLFGLATLSELVYLRRDVRSDVENRLKKMVRSGEVKRVKIRGLDNNYFSLSENMENRSFRIDQSIRILSPFDNMIIQRKRVLDLFDFDYQIECYVPKQKRKYGYFVLPLLMGDRFVGRMDAKADRKLKTLQVKNLVMELNAQIDDHLIEKLAASVTEFSKFNQCESIEIREVTPQILKNPLMKAIHSIY